MGKPKSDDELSSDERNRLHDKTFAGPNRTFPIPDIAHARNALARAAQHASPAVEAEVRRAVHAKYPSLGLPKDARTKTRG